MICDNNVLYIFVNQKAVNGIIETTGEIEGTVHLLWPESATHLIIET